jgi:transposase
MCGGVRPIVGSVVAEPVCVRRLTDQEGQKLQRIVCRGTASSVRYRRAMMLLASAGGNRVPVIAKLVQADEDTVRDVIHRFNEVGLACLDPQWAGGRPRLLSPDDEDFVVQTAITRPAKLGQPFTRWSIRKLVAYLRKVHGRVILIGREALRCLLARRGITFQRTKTWKRSPDPERDAKLDRIEHVLDRLPDRVFAFDEFGPRHPPHRRLVLGPGRSPRTAPCHLPPHPRRPLLPRLLLRRRRHPLGREPPTNGSKEHPRAGKYSLITTTCPLGNRDQGVATGRRHHAHSVRQERRQLVTHSTGMPGIGHPANASKRPEGGTVPAGTAHDEGAVAMDTDMRKGEATSTAALLI